MNRVLLLLSFPILKNIVKAGAGKGWMQAKPGLPVITVQKISNHSAKIRNHTGKIYNHNVKTCICSTNIIWNQQEAIKHKHINLVDKPNKHGIAGEF